MPIFSMTYYKEDMKVLPRPIPIEKQIVVMIRPICGAYLNLGHLYESKFCQ